MGEIVVSLSSSAIIHLAAIALDQTPLQEAAILTARVDRQGTTINPARIRMGDILPVQINFVPASPECL